MKMNTGITFKLYLLARTRSAKQKGFLFLWKQKGKLVREQKSVPFNSLDELPDKIQAALKRAKIEWPISTSRGR